MTAEADQEYLAVGYSSHSADRTVRLMCIFLRYQYSTYPAFAINPIDQLRV